MFEVKVDERIENLATTDNDKKFLEDARKEEICSVIDSLTEDDFISLQKNIMKSFDAVQALFDIVKGEIKHENISFTNILLALNEAYLESSESSFYFKSEYVRLLGFLNEIRIDSDVKEEELLEKFKETIESPFCSTRDAILKAIFTRNELKDRIALDTQIQEVQGVNMLNALCEKIRKIVLYNVNDEELQESLRGISPSQIRDGLIKPICNLKEYCLSHPLDKDFISAVLDARKNKIGGCSNDFHRHYSSIRSDMDRLATKWLKISNYDDAIEQLMKKLSEISEPHFESELNILKQVKDSSKRIRRKFYSGKKIAYKSIDGTCDYYIYLDDFRDNLFGALKKHKNESIENNHRQAMDDINSKIVEWEKRCPFVEEKLTYDYEKKLDNTSDDMPIEEVMKDIQEMMEYICFDGIFFRFFKEIARDELRERLSSESDQRKTIYTAGKEFMWAIEKLIGDTPEVKHLIVSSNAAQLDLYSHQLDLYSQFLNKRNICEEDVIDAVIGVKASVYQKENNN